MKYGNEKFTVTIQF